MPRRSLMILHGAWELSVMGSTQIIQDLCRYSIDHIHNHNNHNCTRAILPEKPPPETTMRYSATTAVISSWRHRAHGREQKEAGRGISEHGGAKQHGTASSPDQPHRQQRGAAEQQQGKTVKVHGIIYYIIAFHLFLALSLFLSFSPHLLGPVVSGLPVQHLP